MWFLRKAELGDLQQIMQLETQIFGSDAWSERNMRAELTSAWGYYLVACSAADRSQIDGYIGMYIPKSDTADVQTIAVRTEARGSGLGRVLLQTGMEQARQQGAMHIMLEVRADNPIAENLYRSLGFRQISIRKAYYQPDGVDALIMRAELTEPVTTLAVGAEIRAKQSATKPSQAGATKPSQAGALKPSQAAGVTEGSHVPLILGIESSCDETAVGIVRGDTVLANTVASSMQLHARFGGVVPEIAARAHVEAIDQVLPAALAEAGVSLDEVDAIAVTTGPGLAGALMVGLAAAKAISAVTAKPLYAVNHLVGHVAAAKLGDPDRQIALPTIALLVSGGHTELLKVNDLASDVTLLGSTIDDAAGEAFDKVARMLGLGYPGGPAIDQAANQGGRSHAIRFPRGLSLPKDLEKHPYDFSFSGLKTAVGRYLQHEQAAGRAVNIPDVAASFTEAVVDVLATKAVAACVATGIPRLLLGGGVAANSRLREVLAERCLKAGIELFVPPLSLCTDNGAMIAALGAILVRAGASASGLEVPAVSSLPVETIQL